MTLITKPDFTYVWASGGAVVAPNDSKKQLGWVAEAPPFQYDNWLQNRQDQMLAHINQRGIPAWDALTNYEAGSLSYVQGSDGKVYKSVAASGPSSVVSNPTTDGTDTYWTIAFADVGAFLTQVAGDARYTQRSNNLSDLTNVAAARTNLALGTAATATLTTSTTDTTAGRVLKVGDFGLGAVTAPLVLNCNNIRDSGTYSYDYTVGSVNGPSGLNYGSLVDVAFSHAGHSQLFLEHGSSRLFTRSSYIGHTAWSPWVEVATSANSLGQGQSWQNVFSQRVIGTTYTNTTGKPIQVSIWQASDSSPSLIVDGVTVATVDGSPGSGSVQATAIVPQNSTYRVTAAVSGWAELR